MKVARNYYEIQPRRKQHLTFMRETEVSIEEIKPPVVLFLDQASNGGYSLYDSESRLFMSGYVQRGNTRLPEFKKKFIEFISLLVDTYRIETIFYEEVYNEANLVTTEVLFYLKHAIQDLGYFSENLKVYGISSGRWKSDMAKPDKFKFGKSDEDKKEVRKWVKEIYPLIGVTVQDEFDAIGMGIAVMIKGKGKENFYKQAKYNKRLPVHFHIYESVFNSEKAIEVGNDLIQDLDEYEKENKKREEEIISKFRKPFREAYKVGGLVELELDRRKGIETLFKQFLSHKDALAYVRIPKDYKYWGIFLLKHSESPERFETENNKNLEYILLCARKKRL